MPKRRQSAGRSRESIVGSRASAVDSRRSTVESRQSTVDADCRLPTPTADSRGRVVIERDPSESSTAAASPSSARRASSSTSRADHLRRRPRRRRRRSLTETETASPRDRGAAIESRDGLAGNADGPGAPGHRRVGRRASTSTAIGWHEYSVRRLGRSVPDLAARSRDQGRSRPGRVARAARRRAAGARRGGPRGPDRQRTDAAWLLAQARCARRLDAGRRTASTIALGRRARGGDGTCTRTGRRATIRAVCRVWVDRERARFGAWYEMFPRSAGPDPTRSAHVPRGGSRAARASPTSASTCVYLPPIHPIGRSFRKGRNNSLARRPGRSGKPVGDRLGRRRAHRGRTRARHARRLRRVPRGSRAARPRDRARSRVAVLAGSPLGARAPRVVPPPARRHDQVRREPAEEVPGHLPARLRVRRLARRCGRRCSTSRCSGSSRGVRIFRVDNPHTKTFGVLGVADRRGARARTRDVLFLSEAFTRPSGDALPGQGRVHAVVHLLHLAQHEGGADRLLHRADRRRGARVLPAEPVRQHARHPPRLPAARRPAGVRGAAAARGDARRELRHLQRLRAVRGPARSPAPRSTPTPRSISSASGTGTGPATSRSSSRGSTQIRHSAPALQFDTHAAVPRDRQPADHRVQQDRAPPGSSRGLAASSIVNLDPLHMQHGFVDVRRLRPGDSVTTGPRSARRRTVYTWRGEWNYVRFDPDVRQGHSEDRN